LNVIIFEHLNCADTVGAAEPPERPDTPPRADLLNTRSKRSLDFAVQPVLSDNVDKSVQENSDCNDNSLSNGHCQLDNSFVVPLEESFRESTEEVESLKRNICLSDSSPDDSKYSDALLLQNIVQGDHLSGKPGNVREFETCQGNVRDAVNSQGIVREMSGKQSCRGKVTQNRSLLDEYLHSYGYLNISISFKNSA